MVVKLDMEKAYDCINWSFLEKFCFFVGFKSIMLELIMCCVTLAFVSVIWNGEKLESFQPSRGLR